MKRIEGRARSVRELLDEANFTIDFYQREYAWQERQVRELVDDLTGKFLDFHDPNHSRHEVEHYGHYFLGAIVVSNKRDKRYIVDGQQRLTTLTLLLIYLNHLQSGRDEIVSVASLIYSETYGRKTFNLNVPDRTDAMRNLLEGAPLDSSAKSESIQNISARYDNIADHFPEELAGKALPYFIDWLRENVHFVEIEAYSDEDAYTIFETMNDRGLTLSLPDMLKGYILANIRLEEDQRKVNSTWKKRMKSLKSLGDEEDVDFFKDWLRARYAETIRAGRKGAENKDYERIGSEFHRWVRERRDRIGLGDSDSFMDFVERDLRFYAEKAFDIRHASTTLVDGWESIYYNEDRGFTLQRQAMLAPLEPDDAPEVVRKKVALVADYLDIWLARRVWNFRTIAYSSVKYTLFTLTKELRGLDVPALSHFLRQQLDEQLESFAGEPRLRLHKQNYRQIRHILARLTHWIETQCGLASHFGDLVSHGRARPFEIEHIWADHHERFADVFEHPADFESARNQLGGLLLLQRGLNQSLGDATYEAKREAYVTKGENLLARSLHPQAYSNNPGFLALMKRTGLDFQPYEDLGPAEQTERQELYIRLAEWVWNPSRLDLDGEKPPVHEPIMEPGESRRSPSERSHGREARLAFLQRLLLMAQASSDLYRGSRATGDGWISARRHNQSWNYCVLANETRIELYIKGPNVQKNKAVFDALAQQKDAIEEDFGDKLFWQRLDEKKACRISYSVPGGWADESTWDSAISAATEIMTRLHAAMGLRVEELRD